MSDRYIPRLQKMYQEFVPQLEKELGVPNCNQIPKLKKIVVNVGVGEAMSNIKLLEGAISDLKAITGQLPTIRRSKKSIAAFKLREGAPIGCCVTLRGRRMYEFFDRLVNVAIPRIRDFRGFSAKAFDGRGNYSLGLKEQIIFPEINYDKVDVRKILSIEGEKDNIFENNKAKVEKWKSLAKKFGTKCEEVEEES